MIVKAVTPTERNRLHAYLPVWFDPAVQCNPSVTWPGRDEVASADYVYAAYVNGNPVAVALVGADGHVLWLNGHPAHIVAGCTAIGEVAFAELGAFWGAVTNPELRDAIVQASGHRVTPRRPGSRVIGWGVVSDAC